MPKSKSHCVIALVACVLAVFSVLPAVGYQALPVKAQISRLETLLEGEGMLSQGQITPAATEPDQKVRAAITDAVDYLANAQDAKLPDWFDKKLGQSDVFKTNLGFEKTWNESGEIYDPEPYLGTYLYLPDTAIDISGYQWVVNPQNQYGKNKNDVTIDGERGTYQIDWTIAEGGIPSLKILLNGKPLLEQNLESYIDDICNQYPPGQVSGVEATLEDMSLRLDTAEISVLLIFNNVEVRVDTTNDTIQYSVNLKDLYLRENS